MTTLFIVITVAFGLLGMAVQGKLRRKFSKYSQTGTSSGMSGREIAERMLADHGIRDVKVISVQGQLTDHYDPRNKTVNLSEPVYGTRSVAAAAVAAHEVGHAVQHAKAYAWLNFRSAMVPAVQFASGMLRWVLLAGIIVAMSGNVTILGIGIVLFAVTTLFSLVTLPVEFDASRRALAWMTSSGTAVRQEHDRARDALKWAAMTYVVAALASVAQLAYFAMIFLGSRD